MTGPTSQFLSDSRLHLQHGPIDLIIEAFGCREEVATGYRQAQQRFQTVLEELVSELPQLRAQSHTDEIKLEGVVARRMASAVIPLGKGYITPMAAVAGAVADEILEALVCGRQLEKAYVNNGGDIAIHLSDEQQFDIGLIVNPAMPETAGKVRLTSAMNVKGVASSGWGGRSFSFGIADSVTVLAKNAAAADAAATVIANAVNLIDHPNVIRKPASEMDPDSDLDDRLVTVEVGRLSTAEIELAMAGGMGIAEQLREQDLITAAAICVAGKIDICGVPGALIEQPVLMTELSGEGTGVNSQYS